MTVLTWLFFALSFITGGYIGYKLTRTFYKRKVRRLLKNYRPTV